MEYHSEIENELRQSLAVKNAVLESTVVVASINAVARVFIETLANHGKILFAGNGGSAADAQHLAAELVSKYNFDRPGLPSLSLSTDTSMITAISNDYGYEKLFSRQIEAHGSKEDAFVGISTSGNSENVIEAVDAAKAIGMKTIAFCGSGGALADRVDVAIQIPSQDTPRIQEQHITVGHIICGIVERHFFAEYQREYL